MKMILPLLMITLLTSGMGWAPDPPEEPRDKPIKLLAGYLWENSDQLVPGKAILMPSITLTGQIISVSADDETMTFHSIYSGREVWYASHEVEYYGRANLTVETHTSIYKTIIKDDPALDPEPDTPAFGTRQEGYYHGQRNGDRATCYFYPIPPAKNVRLFFDGKLAMTIKDSSVRQNGSNGLLWKPKAEWNVRNNGGVGIGEYGVKHKSCYIEY